MQIADRVSLWGGKKSPLPPGARWVAYLQSTGTQYILLPANNYDGIDIMLNPVSNSNGYGNIGRRTGTRSDSIGFRSSTGWVFRAYSALTETNDTNRSLRHATVHGTTATLDGVTYTLSDTWNTLAFANKPFALFGSYNPSTGELYQFSSCQIGACALYVGSEKVYDFRSIAIGTTGYMLDLVSGEYLPYGNAGTGDFIVGPDAPAMTGGGCKRLCVKRSHRRSSRPSARFWHAAHLPRTWKEVA